jgi:hypothetical protein
VAAPVSFETSNLKFVMVTSKLKSNDRPLFNQRVIIDMPSPAS